MRVKRTICSMLAASAGILLLVSAAGAADPKTVKNKAYDLWVSPSFGIPPYTPFHDCLRFPVNQVCLDMCGDCGTFTESKIGSIGLSLWTGTVPCGGLNLVFVGTSLDGNLLPDGQGADVLGASMIGIQQSTSFGAQGVANPVCSISALSEPSAGTPAPARPNPYDKNSTKRPK